MSIAAIIADIVGLPTWLKHVLAYLVLALAMVGAYEFWAHHQRAIGAKACEDEVKAATTAAEKRAGELQAKLDAAASRDAGLQAALKEPSPVMPAIALPASCRYTQAQLDALKKVLE